MFSMLVLASLEPQLEPGWPVSYVAQLMVHPTPFNGGLFAITGVNLKFYVFGYDGSIPPPWPKIWPTKAPMLFFPFYPYPVANVDDDSHFESLVPGLNSWVIVDLTTGDTQVVRHFWDDAAISSVPTFFDANVDGYPEAYWFEADYSITQFRLFKYDPAVGTVESTVVCTEFSDRGMVVARYSLTQTFGDFDGDGSIEEAILIPDTSYSSALLLIDPLLMQVKRRVSVKDMPYYGPRAGDVDGDGFPELVIATDSFRTFTDTGEVMRILLLDLSNDSVKVKQIYTIFYPSQLESLSLCSIIGDDRPEVCFTYLNLYGHCQNRFLLLNGNWYMPTKEQEPICYSKREIVGVDPRASIVVAEQQRNVWFPPPVFADLDGDGSDDFFPGSKPWNRSDSLIAAESFSKGILWTLPLPLDPDTPRGTGTVVYPFIWDVDDDGFYEFPVASWYLIGFFNGESRYQVNMALFELPLQNPHLGWPMLYHDPWNTNNYDFWPPQVGVRESSGKVQGSLTLRPTLKGLLVRSSKSQKLPLKVYDPAGRLLYKAELTLKPGNNLVEIPGKGVRLVMVGKAKVKVVGR